MAITDENFPDEHFKAFLLQQSYGEDAILTKWEAAKVSSLTLNGKDIKRLKGLDHFIALNELDISENEIKGTAMDELVASLPVVNGKFHVINYTNGTKSEKNVMNSLQVAAAKKRMDATKV